VALPQPPFTDTVTLDYSPPEYVPTKVIDPPGAMAFDFTASTVLRQSQPLPSAASAASASSAAATVPSALAVQVAPAPVSSMQRLRAHSLGIAAVLVVTVALGTLLRHVNRPQAMPQASPGTPAPPSVDATASTAASSTADPATAVSATTAALGSTTAPARPDLAGTWRGAYFDASGRQLLRVVSLSISRVHDDGGIEGTLQYAAPSGEGECQLHPRRSAYSAGRQRLQLSPESCSPHYPRELGVPLDFDRVNPEASTLKNGRIEAPTGEVITVRLERGT
jgi:hypothetical protein